MKFHEYNFLFISLILLSVFLGVYFTSAQYNITADIPSICGNNVLDSGEECDGSDLGGQTCQSRGYVGGILVCGIGCVFDVSGCSVPGTGGATYFGGFAAPQTIVSFSGKAYPQAKVFLLKDGQLSGTVVSGIDAKFQINLGGISVGNYIFSLYAEDDKKRNSRLVNFSVEVKDKEITQIANIIIPPTIDADKSEVKKGDGIVIFGQTVPQTSVNILITSVKNKKEFLGKTVSEKNGNYFYNFDTLLFDYGDYEAKSGISVAGSIGDFGRTVNFIIGTKNVEKKKTECLPADLNCDGRVDLVDFSIAVYWYKKPSPLTAVDLNNDKIVDLTDFSIIAHWWTG